MPYFRKVPLITNEIYHVFNRGIDGRITFSNQREFIRAYQVIKYYRFSSPPVNFSKFIKARIEGVEKYNEASWGEKLVSIMCYCFMPNHFHFLLRQETAGGISKFLSQFLNSYTRYFNIKNERVGPLFLNDFKNVLVESEEQLLHLSRYIHLNPYSSKVVESLEDLYRYEWSSLTEYLGGSEDYICNKDTIMSLFKTKESYKKFILDRADYQRELKQIENLLID